MDEKFTVIVDIDLEELIPGFIQNRQKDLADLKTAAGDEKFEDLRSIGHSLKGVGGGYGFMQITSIGAAIEKAAVDRDMDTVLKNIEELDEFLKHVEIRYE